MKVLGGYLRFEGRNFASVWLLLGDAAWTVSGEQAMAEGWFGPASSRFASRIGDVVVAARDDAGVSARWPNHSCPGYLASTAR